VGGVESDEQQGRGRHAVWCLSPVGASALAAKSSREKPTKPKEISFPTAGAGYSLPTLVHDAQMSTYLLSLLVGFSAKTRLLNEVWDVVDIFGNGEQWGTGGAVLFPDAVVKLMCNGKPATMIIENDSGTMNEKRIKDKAIAYLRYMMMGNEFSWSRPWILFCCPQNKIAVHERAILSAYEETGLLTMGGGGKVGRIAVVTHEDTGALGASGDIYRVFSPKENALLPTRYALQVMAWETFSGSSLLCGFLAN